MISLIDSNLFFTIVAASVTLFLGLLVFVHDRKSASNQIFIMHCAIGTLWAIVNYFSVVAPQPIALTLIRLVIFLAVPYLALYLMFVLNFPSEQFVIKRKELLITFGLAVLMMIAALSPLVFVSTTITKAGNITPVPGPFIPFFGIGIVSFFIITCILVIRKYLAATGQVKQQWTAIGVGLGLAYLLLIAFVFLRVVLFNDPTYVRFSPLFILPIFIGVAYAILRHRLFNIKVIAAETITFLLLVVSFVEVFIAQSTLARVLGIFATVFTLVFGMILIRSVLREVKQREELQVLTKQLEAANEQLKQLDKARAEFISIASHQLRTPPATIKWYLGAILTGDFGALNQELKAAIERTNVTNNAQIHTIDDLLNASRIERGKLEFFFEKAKVDPIVSSLVEQLQPLAEMKKMYIEYTPPSQPLPEILLDQEKVRQVINNMIDNAIKYSKQGTIVVTLKQDQDNIVVSVKDNGKGIAPDEITTLFQKYSRGKDSVTHATGLGLGMYVAKVVVEQHQGKIWAESPGVGQGATFSFSLPIHSDLKPTVVDLAKSV